MSTTALLDNQDSYQVIITGITWNPSSNKMYYVKRDYSELPEQFNLDIPPAVLAKAKKAEDGSFEDILESFCYDFLTHKYSHEVYHCQVWLPL